MSDLAEAKGIMNLREKFGALNSETFPAFVARLHAENEALRKQQEWQDIATAPKDGTHIWLYEGDTTNKTWRGEWDATIEKWVFGVTSDDHTVVVMAILNPTHWQPQPKPPEASQD